MCKNNIKLHYYIILYIVDESTENLKYFLSINLLNTDSAYLYYFSK